MEIVQKLVAVALVSVVNSDDGLQLSLAITLLMAAASGMVQPYFHPQAGHRSRVGCEHVVNMSERLRVPQAPLDLAMCHVPPGADSYWGCYLNPFAELHFFGTLQRPTFSSAAVSFAWPLQQ
eukprot:Skav218114  [mRNA]  locus=scaffold759:226674:227039:- [translate_table: standard]